MTDMKELFNELNKLDVNKHKETIKQGNRELAYLSWTWAVEAISRNHDFEYTVKKFDGGKPYIRDENLGYMVFTEVTVDGITKEMWLPVMDGRNKAMLDKPYSLKDKWGNEYTVQKCTMFDINTAIMRCLTKNLAMFGLGLYIYAGEDLPEVEKNENGKTKTTAQQVFELHKKYYNSQTLNSFIKASLNKAKTRKITEIPEDDLETLMTMIMSSMRTIEEEHKGESNVNQGN